MRFITIILPLFLLISNVYASELNFQFGSPSFSGQGKSSHYLTVENIEKTRKDAVKAAEKAAADKVIEDAKNIKILYSISKTNYNKYIWC